MAISANLRQVVEGVKVKVKMRHKNATKPRKRVESIGLSRPVYVL
jgi:hypothetical protein